MHSKLPEPISDWFGYMPHKLETAGLVVKVRESVLFPSSRLLANFENGRRFSKSGWSLHSDTWEKSAHSNGIQWIDLRASCLGWKGTHDRATADLTTLITYVRRADSLEQENHQLRGARTLVRDTRQEPAHMLNGNGKRPMTDYRL